MSDTSFGSGLQLPFGAPSAPATDAGSASADVTPAPGGPTPQQSNPASFGDGLRKFFGGPGYTAPDQNASPLDQSADFLRQRIDRANQIATNPIAQFFAPEQVQKAREFVPQAAEKLQQIRTQQATMQANRQQAENLGLHPGDVADEASQADRVEVAKARALKGDLKVFQGLQVVDPKAAESIQSQVHEVIAGHLDKAQLAFDSLANVRNQGEYTAKVDQLRKDGTLTDLEALGLKVPQSFDAFSQAKPRENQALRDARIGVERIRQGLEERNTYQPMEKKEAETYGNRLTTAYGDTVSVGTWSRNAASGTRGLVVNGMSDPRDLGKTFTLGSQEQRKAVAEAGAGAVPKEDMEKARAFTRTYQLATTDAEGKKLPDGKVNTNPNVQQGMAEGLASMLRGGSGGANVGLLKIELAKRGWAQGAIDGLISNYGGALNTLFSNEKKPYLSATTQKQIRDVMDVLQMYNKQDIGGRMDRIGERAGALGFDSSVFGLKAGEVPAVDEAIERGRQAQIARMTPFHQAIGGGDGVLQLGAQRPGAGATGMPTGAQPTNQLPGATPLQTPVQQAQQPQPGPQAPTGGAPTAPQQPVTVAGQSVNVPLPAGASPNFVPALQRIESGNERNPWTAGTKGSSALGAFQFINDTWAANKPPGAPARAADATPEQQAQALATLTAKNAAALKGSGLPVNDTTLYVAHNLGAGGAASLLSASPTEDARTVVGIAAARNNPLFFKGRPTVATVLQRYADEMSKGGSTAPASTGTAAPAQAAGGGFMDRLRGWLQNSNAGAPTAAETFTPEAQAQMTRNAAEIAPAAASTLGAIGGAAIGGPVGGAAGGAAGGGAGQALRDYLLGNEQSPAKIAEQAALGGVLGVASEARPVAAAAGRMLGSGAIEAGAEAAKGGDAEGITEAGVKGAAEAAGGEAFGRALGMAGHKVWSLFAPDAKKAVREAAQKYHDAEQTLRTEAPKLPGAGGASTANPAYDAATKAKAEAETVLKDAGLKPDEAAYAHKVSSEGVPRQEAEVGRPGETERQNVGAGYQQLEREVASRGVGAPKATPKLADGPVAAVENKQVSAKHAELAQRVEAAITAPSANWQEKWNQLKDARSALLDAERDAMTSTATGRTQTAKDMRTLADTVRTQQAKVANIVFGAKEGPAFMERLKILDTRYRNLMEATNGGDLAKAASLKGEAGREAQRKFEAFAHDDPQAIAAYRAMRGVTGDAYEKTVPWTVAAEGIPGVGKVVKVVKLAGMLGEWARERTAGNPVKFEDLVKRDNGAAGARTARDVAGGAVQRAAVMP
ncbi:MAG: hypothetical protein AAGL98_00180 [Planctomycetota bacterium]